MTPQVALESDKTTLLRLYHRWLHPMTDTPCQDAVAWFTNTREIITQIMWIDKNRNWSTLEKGGKWNSSKLLLIRVKRQSHRRLVVNHLLCVRMESLHNSRVGNNYHQTQQYRLISTSRTQSSLTKGFPIFFLVTHKTTTINLTNRRSTKVKLTDCGQTFGLATSNIEVKMANEAISWPTGKAELLISTFFFNWINLISIFLVFFLTVKIHRSVNFISVRDWETMYLR